MLCMRSYCINNVNDIFKAKFFIEEKLIAAGKLEEEMQLDEFVKKYFDVSKMVYLHEDDILPFAIYKIEDEVIFIYTDEDKKDLIENKLKSMNFDFSGLKEVRNHEFYKLIDPMEDKALDMFILNNKYYM